MYIFVSNAALSFNRFEPENVIASKRSGWITTGLFGWMYKNGVVELKDVDPSNLVATDMQKS